MNIALAPARRVSTNNLCAISGDARLGQNAARAPFAAGDRGENEREIPRSFFASYRWETRVTQASCLWGQRGSSRLQDSGMMPVCPQPRTDILRSRGSFALVLSSRAQARDLTYSVVSREVGGTTIHACEIPHRFRGSG